MNGDGDGNSCPDAAGVGTSTATVRSERSGQGDGRVYHIAFTATDGRGGACTGEVLVCVRHDHRPDGVCGDGGPLFDSTAGVTPCPPETCSPADSCVPDDESLRPHECDGADVPANVERRVDKARHLLARADHAKGRKEKRLRLRAARHLRRAATVAAHSGKMDSDCREAMGNRLDDAGTCAVCEAGDDDDQGDDDQGDDDHGKDD